MATTAKDIFDKAVTLMDEQSDTGLTEWADTDEYKNKALYILNTLMGEVFPLSDGYSATEPGKRPVCTPVTALSDNVPVDDVLARTVLPYGLAAHLSLGEDTVSASFFQQRYEELLLRLGAMLPAAWDTPVDVYNLDNGHGRFARW